MQASQMKPLIRQFTRFVVVGGVATAIQYAILIACVEALGWTAAAGSGVGFVLSSIVNYSLNYRFTFRSSRAHRSAVWRFVVVSSGGLLLNVGLMALFVSHWRVPYMPAQVLVTGITLVWNFTGSACWSFVSPEPAPASRRS
jgi:putative flippase GtrA